MAGFLYFLEGEYWPNEKTERIVADIERLRIKHIIESRRDPITRCSAENGPGEKPGITIGVVPETTTGGTLPRVGYYPDEQTWVQGQGARGWWIGWKKDERPRARDLVKRKTVDGELVDLADDVDQWLIPHARTYYAGTMLPHTFRREADGTILWAIKDEYRSLAKRAESFWDLIMEHKGEEFELEWRYLWELASDALMVNYRLGYQEIDILQLFDTPTLNDACQALCGWNAWIEHVGADEKKKDGSIAATVGGGN